TSSPRTIPSTNWPTSTPSGRTTSRAPQRSRSCCWWSRSGCRPSSSSAEGCSNVTDLAVRRRGALTPGQWIGRALVTIVLLVFAAFFILPIIWLLLAPTKTNTQLLLDGPFSFGSFDQLVANWNELFAFGSGVFATWIGNSAYYSFAALAL